MASQASRSELHEAARAWAQAGFFVFPCKAGDKRPANEHGLNEATLDLDQIDAWWSENPSYNIGIAPARSAMFVLDCDGPLGVESLAELVATHSPLPPTLTIQTPRGAGHTHQWFAGSCPSTVGKIGTKLDTRGEGGYVLVPPSSVNGVEYTYLGECDEVCDAPDWIAAAVAETQKHHEAAEGVVLDLPANVDRARTLLRDYVARGEVAIEGAGGDNKIYAVAAEVLSLGLTPKTCFDVMWEDYAPHCVPFNPEWFEGFLQTKIVNAMNHAQNEPGAYAAPDAAAVFGGLLDKGTDLAKVRSRFTPLELTDVQAFAEPEWTIPGLIPKGGTIQIIGPKKSFKTFLALDLVLGIATGTETFGHVPDAAPVVYVAGENASAMVLNHIPAWRLAREYEGNIPLYVVPNMPKAMFPTEFVELVDEIKKLGIAPGVVVIDTATRALRGLDENSAKDMGMLSEACEFVQKQLACTLLLIRHTGKDTARGGRGSNVIEGDFDTVLTVSRHEKSMSVKMAVTEQRNAAEREEPYTFVGRQFGQSLAFFQTDFGTYHEATKEEDPFDRLKIGAALRELKAIGAEHGVSTHVLASAMAPQGSLTAEMYAAALDKMVANMNKAAKGKLSGYVEGEGRSMRWCLPTVD